MAGREVSREPLAAIEIVGLEGDLGVERKTAERGVQLAGYGGGPCVSAWTEATEGGRASVRQCSATPDGGGMELGE